MLLGLFTERDFALDCSTGNLVGDFASLTSGSHFLELSLVISMNSKAIQIHS